MFQKITEIVGKTSSPAAKYIKAANEQVLHDVKEVSAQWEEYIQDLFHDNQEKEDLVLECSETGPPILKSEVKWTISKTKNGKTSGPDKVYMEMIKALNDDGINLTWKFVNHVYESGSFSKDMLKSIFVLLPKRDLT